MSIIYDALKKVEKSGILKVKADKEERYSKSKLKIYFFYFLVICFGVFIGNIFFSFLSQPKGSLTQQLEPPAEETLPEPTEEPPLESAPPTSADKEKKLKESLVLSGVFFSQNEGYALINNQIVKEGNLIEGATVKRIGLNEVELEFEGLTVKLSTNQ